MGREMERGVQRASVGSVSTTMYLRRTTIAVLVPGRISISGQVIGG